MNSKQAVAQMSYKDQKSLQVYMNPNATLFIPNVTNENYQLQVFYYRFSKLCNWGVIATFLTIVSSPNIFNIF